MQLPKVSRAMVIIGTIIVILGLVAAFAGWTLYKKLTTNTVVAYFPETLALYPGDKIQIMGVKVGTIESIEPAGDKMKVTFNYENKFKVPVNATASILNPSLVASRTIQLSPLYTGGPVMESDAARPDPLIRVRVNFTPHSKLQLSFYDPKIFVSSDSIYPAGHVPRSSRAYTRACHH